MFDKNADIYRWVKEVSEELSRRSESAWGEKMLAALSGFTSGEILNGILSAVTEICKTPLLREIGRQDEADELVQALRHALQLDKTNYYVNCSWRDREDIDSWTRRIVCSLNGLANCDASFVRGRFLGKGTPYYTAPVDYPIIKPLLSIPPPEVQKKFGYRFTFFFDDLTPEKPHWTLTFETRRGVDRQVHHCALELPQQGDSLNPLVRRELMLCIVREFVASLNPDRIVVRPVELWSSTRGAAEGLLPPWMIYLNQRSRAIPNSLHAQTRLELEEGTLLVLAEQPISRTRPAAVLEASEILRMLKEGKDRLQ